MFEVPMKILVLLFCLASVSCVASSSPKTDPVFNAEDPVIDSYKEFQKTCYKFPTVDLASTQVFVHCENSVCMATRLTMTCVNGEAEYEVESVKIKLNDASDFDNPPEVPLNEGFMI